MKILVAHNSYQQRGGEDMVFEQESAMLAAAGHEVRRFTVSNDHIQGTAQKITAALSVMNNKTSVAGLCEDMDAFTPDILHIHNFFPTLSPTAIEAAARRAIPVVLTLHNYRMICANAMLMRDGKVCEDCVGHSKLPGLLHRCYRGSAVGSGMVGMMGMYFKKLLKTYPQAVTLIALTEFAKSRFVADGVPADLITVRGNTLPDPGAGLAEREKRIVYVGRLSPEKGIDTILKAGKDLPASVEIIGDGPERAKLEAIAPSHVRFAGKLPPAQVIERIKSATALAVPSRWYEGFPMVVLEAMATGTPILASRMGSLAEIVAHEKTGLLVPSDDVAAWHEAMKKLLNDTAGARAMGAAARLRFVDSFSQSKGVESLETIYALARRKLPCVSAKP